MRTIAVRLQVLPAGTSDALLHHVTRCKGVLAAMLDDQLTLRVLARDDLTGGELEALLADAVAPRSS